MKKVDYNENNHEEAHNNQLKVLTILWALLFIFALTSCSSRPKLYPNTKLKQVGLPAAEKDIDSCMEDAKSYLKSSKGKQVAKSTGFGAIVGGAVGAVSGLFTGDIGESLVKGGALGATAGGVGQALSPDQLRRRYVNTCLAKKGYQVLGWD